MKPIAALALLASLPALAVTDADLARCRAIGEAAARLACYDALAPTPGAAPRAAPAAPAAPAPAAKPAVPEFGFESRAVEQAPDAVESRILGSFDGWGPNSRIRLENGQVWQIIDGSRGTMAAKDPKVRITRATFGTFMMEVEGKRQAARVRRVE